jgi:hypothetical protein
MSEERGDCESEKEKMIRFEENRNDDAHERETEPCADAIRRTE